MSASVFDLGGRGRVLVTGPDTWSFLDSLLSQALDALVDGDAVPALLLTPSGKLGDALVVLRVGDDAWLDVDPGRAAAVAATLARFRIRVRVEIAEGEPDWGALAVRGPGAAAALAAALGVEVPGAGPPGELRVVAAPWGDDPGFVLLGTAPARAAGLAALTAHGIPVGSREAYEAARIEAGVPAAPDLPEGLIPQEAFLDRTSVSFTKGCFLGQELVCRIDTRGHVNRLLRGLRIDGVPRLEPGAPVRAGDRVMGSVTSRAVVPGTDRTVALALVRREVEPGSVVHVETDAGGVEAAVVALPER